MARVPKKKLPADVVRLNHPLEVPATFATMHVVMGTSAAIRISFGESTPDGTMWHTSVALDRDTAEALVKSINQMISQLNRPGYADEVVEENLG